MGAILKSRLFRWGLCSAVIVAAAMLWFQWMYPTYIFRYRLAVEVETPNGMRHGSSIIEVSYAEFYSLSGVPNLRLGVSGEAVYVDLGERKNLFVTLTTWDSGRGSFSGDYRRLEGPLNSSALPLKALGLEWLGRPELPLDAQVILAKTKGAIEVSFANLPTLVTFENLDDPNSVRVVQPDAFSSAFGSRYTLKRVTLELSDAPQVEIVENILPWLSSKKEEWKNVHSRGVKDPLIVRLFYDAFKEPGIWDGGL